MLARSFLFPVSFLLYFLISPVCPFFLSFFFLFFFACCLMTYIQRSSQRPHVSSHPLVSGACGACIQRSPSVPTSPHPLAFCLNRLHTTLLKCPYLFPSSSRNSVKDRTCPRWQGRVQKACTEGCSFGHFPRIAYSCITYERACNT